MSSNVAAHNSFTAAPCWSSRRWLPKLVIIALPSLTASQTEAAEVETCKPHSEILTHFASKYREAPKAVGLTDAGNLIEVLSTGDGSTWSIIVTTPNGMSCLVAAGESWQELRETAAEDALFRQ